MEMGSRELHGGGGVKLRRMSGFDEFMPLFPLYEAAFPPEERRGAEAFRAAFQGDIAEFWLLEHGGEVRGFLNTWRFEECLYGEHFAVFPHARGKRIGEYALQAILQEEHLPFLIEVEPPDDEIKTRRKAFYERMGLRVISTTYRQPPYEEGGREVSLYLMSNDASLQGDRLRRAVHSLSRYIYRGADVDSMLGE